MEGLYRGSGPMRCLRGPSAGFRSGVASVIPIVSVLATGIDVFAQAPVGIIVVQRLRIGTIASNWPYTFQLRCLVVSGASVVPQWGMTRHSWSGCSNSVGSV